MEAAVRRYGRQAIPWMGQQARAPVGSDFWVHLPGVALEGNFGKDALLR